MRGQAWLLCSVFSPVINALKFGRCIKRSRTTPSGMILSCRCRCGIPRRSSLLASGETFAPMLCASRRRRTLTGKLSVSNLLTMTNRGFERRALFNRWKLIFMDELSLCHWRSFPFSFFAPCVAPADSGILPGLPPSARGAIQRVPQATGGRSEAASGN